MSRMKCGTILTTVFIWLFFASVSTFPQEGRNPDQNPNQSPKAEGYIEIDAPGICAGCHGDLYENFKKENPHWKLSSDPKLPPDRKGCESCHGPAEKHVSAGGGIDLIFSFNRKDARSRSDACLKCHQREKTFFQSRRGIHQLSAVACNDCHRMHGESLNVKLLKQKEPRLCFNCHPEIESQFRLPTRHKVLEGAMNCTDCHTPHGTRTRASRKTWNKFNVDVCFNCHPEKRGPWAFEHPPVKFEGCMICHSPHGSPNRFLLPHRDVRRVCTLCHGLRHQNDFLSSTEVCINCHTQIHGSNFSNRFFH